MQSLNYQILNSVSELKKLNISSPLVVDTETTGLDTHRKSTRIIGIGLCWSSTECCYIDLSKLEGEELLMELKLFEEIILNNPAYEKWGQNLKFDLRMFSASGINYCSITHDSNVLNYCLWGDRQSVSNGPASITGHGLDEMSLYYLNLVKIRTKTLIPRKTKKNPNPTMLQADQKLVAQYCIEDCWSCYSIIQKQLKLLEQPEFNYAKKIYNEIDHPVTEVIVAMENSGVFIDLPKCQVIETRLRELQAQAIQQAKDIAGHDFDITNRDHIEKIVFDELDVNSEDKVKIKVTKTGKKSVDKKTLSKFADNPFVKTYLDAKAKEKNIGTYLEPINELVSDIDGLLHGSFNQSLTSTGRLSSGGGGLNLQNIPSRTEEGRLIRSLFTSRWKDIGGQILSADYSQMEVRLIAHMANEPIFIEAFNTNKDVHTYVGSLINDVPYEAVTKEQRTAAKTTNLGLIYQMGLQKLMSETGMTEEQALKFLDTYMSKLVKIKWWLGWAKQFVRTNGYAETIFGRRRYMPDIYSSKLYLREAAGREGPNMKVQGTGADIVKLAMKACYDKIKQNSMKSKLILQVHDELVFDVHPNELESMKKLAEDIMPNVVTLKIPLEVEAKLANSWAEAH